MAARFGVTQRVQILPDWTINWLREGKKSDPNWDVQANTLQELYPSGINLSVQRCVFVMCGTTGELQQALDAAYNAGARKFVEGTYQHLWVFDARRKIVRANKTVTVMQIFNANQCYKNPKEEAAADGWRYAGRPSQEVTITSLRDQYVPQAKAAWG